MSGTSMDAIDAALIETDGEGHVERGEALSLPWQAGAREKLWRAVEAAANLTDGSARPAPLADAEREVTLAHKQAVSLLLDAAGLSPDAIDVIGFHGQTVVHRPDLGFTVQLGDGAELAASCGIDVVSDFRSNDMRNKGEGAPFAPAYHQALAHGAGTYPVVFLNLGGVANVTWIDRNEPLLAFDTGPANGLLDQWVSRNSGLQMDEGGVIAGRGRVIGEVLEALMEHPYFERKPPKSLDRFAFDLQPLEGLSEADGAATLVAFSAETVARSVRHMPRDPALWVACGGGRHNPVLMRELSSRLNAPIRPAEDVGLRGDTIEAEAFAYLAVRSLNGLPLSFPGTTGVSKPVSGGIVHRHALA